MTPDDSCFYRDPPLEPARTKVERFVGRMPPRVAYPLILALAVALWTPMAIAAVRFAELISEWLR